LLGCFAQGFKLQLEVMILLKLGSLRATRVGREESLTESHQAIIRFLNTGV